MSSALGRAVLAVRAERRAAMRRVGEAEAGRGARGGAGRGGCGIPQRLHIPATDASVFPAQVTHRHIILITPRHARTECFLALSTDFAVTLTNLMASFSLNLIHFLYSPQGKCLWGSRHKKIQATRDPIGMYSVYYALFINSRFGHV